MAEKARKRRVAAEPEKDIVLVQGASRGIGAALVREILESDATQPVVATCRQPDASRDLAALLERFPQRLTILSLDVSNEDSIANAAADFANRSAQLSMLINCAGLLHDGVLQPERRLSDINVAKLERIFAVNAYGPLLVAKYFAQFFSRTKRCIFANLSARVGSIEDNHLGGWYGYRGSKAAQNMFTRNLSIELKRNYRGIICVALHPGTVNTQLSSPFQSNVAKSKLFSRARAARQLLDVMRGLSLEDNGEFFAWDGSTIAW
ncbi:MAG: SDR family oxidoreductase [Pseudomonadota bacterium]